MFKCRGLAVQHLLQVLLGSDTQSYARPALTMLAHLLKKDIISLKELYASSLLSPSSDETSFLASVQLLLGASLRWIAKADLGSVIGHLVSVALDKIFSEPAFNDIVKSTIWGQPLRNFLLQHLDVIDQCRSHVLPILFKSGLKDYFSFLQMVGLYDLSQSSTLPLNGVLGGEAHILLASLQVGKELGFVVETMCQEIMLTENALLLPVRMVKRLLQQGARSARLAGLSIIVTSQSITKPLHEHNLNCLRHSLSHLHADTDANFRSELYSLTQLLFDRLRAGSAVLDRQKKDCIRFPHASSSLATHYGFLEWYCRFVSWELRPSASYQRHICALKCLLLLLKSGLDKDVRYESLSKAAQGQTRWPFHFQFVTPAIALLLVGLLMDPFDDVRQMASTISEVHLCRHTQNSISRVSILRSALETAERTMLASGRADHADGVAHMWCLIFLASDAQKARHEVVSALLQKSERMLEVAKHSLPVAVERYPLHGLMTSLRYVLARREAGSALEDDTFSRLAAVLQAVWQVVKPILCDDAPEGYLHDDVDDVSDLSTKDMLSYCWRALKEASLLIGVMVQRSAATSSTTQLRFTETVIQLTFSQLSDLRHRGAFSTVAQTWVSCCFCSSGHQGLPGLEHWYDQVLGLLQGKTTINTRRSAGLPALMCGLLIGDQYGKLFPRAVRDLETIARLPLDPSSYHEGSLPQVHAMNCLKDILKNAKLAEQSEQYTLGALQLAADALPSRAWALRNCGLMLFRAMIDRLMGTNDAYKDDSAGVKKIVDFGQHPGLVDLILSLVNVQTSTSSDAEDPKTQGVFPALQLLQRARLPADKKSEVQRAVLALTVSNSWHVREKAARTYAAILSRDLVSTEIKRLITVQATRQNALHGALLCAIYLLQRQIVELRDESTRHCPDESLTYRESIELGNAIQASNSCQITRKPFSEVLKLFNALHGRSNIELYDSDSHDDVYDTNRSTAQAWNTTGIQALEQLANENDANSWLERRAKYIERQARETDLLDDGLRRILEEWVTACETAMIGKSVFTREAVATALRTLQKAYICTYADRMTGHSLLRRVALLIYDLLNDDDEDVRTFAAESSSSLVSCDEQRPTGDVLTPLVAARKLLLWMVKQWPEDRELARVVLERAFGSRSVGDRLEDAALQDIALFAAEKPNLFIDEAKEARAWSRAALKLAPRSLPSLILKQLGHWVETGLDALSTKANEKLHGPLGWSNQSEIFTLGLQVIYGAEVLLQTARRKLRLTVRPSMLRLKLARLSDLCRRNELNCLWLWEIERVLGDAVIGKLSDVHGLLRTVVRSDDLQGVC